MKIFLNFEDVKKLILDSYNGVNEVTVENKEVEFLLDVDGDNFYRLKGEKKSINEEVTSNISDNDTSIKSKTVKKIDPNDSPDFETLVKKKPLNDSGVHPPKEKSAEERNEEAMRRGLMTSGRGSDRALRKF